MRRQSRYQLFIFTSRENSFCSTLLNRLTIKTKKAINLTLKILGNQDYKYTEIKIINLSSLYYEIIRAN